MKNRKHSKIIITMVSLTAALALTVSTGCGGLGALGVLGCAGCFGGLSSIISSYSDDDEEWTLPEHSWTTPETENSESEAETTSPKPEKPSSSVTIDDGAFAYAEYDPADFYASCEELERLASGRDSDAVIALYDELYDEYAYIDEDGSVLYIAYSEDPSDEYLSEQYVEFDKLTTECYDKFMTAISAVCDGPCADDFVEHVGEDYFDAYSGYEPLTDEQTELYNRETELVDEYYTAIEDAEDSGMEDSELVNIVGPIYLELVQVRTQIAESYGYDNYADYADENIYCRDFTSEDVSSFCDTVKKFSAQYYDLLYNSSAYYMPYYLEEDRSTEELLSDIQKYGSIISPLAENSSRILIENKLYSIGDDDSRMSGAYTMPLCKSGVPFIFETTDGDATDFSTLTHEFGHFTAFTQNMNPNILVYSYGSLELSEIHSNGLQALFTYYFDDIYDEYADVMEAYTVINLLSNIVDGCFYDEFQRTIYANPDMTLDEVNQLYKDLCDEYGDTYSTLYEEADYWWIHVSHSFESPMYYFSYAASGLVALEIWLTSETDMDKAISIWEAITKAGSYAEGYIELLDSIGVGSFTNTTSVTMTCQMALSFVENNSIRY